VLREYLVSEAMHALGVPTTRSLAAVVTGEPVLREDALPGAVLTRVAASHIRVGTFEYFAAQGDAAAVRTLVDHALARHYPERAGAGNAALALLGGVLERQARLVARWMALGFVHGVMNTDNMAISGETIDYGPCAFMDAYHPATVFSSIDHGGRYAYANQPRIAHWNLVRLAEALLTAIDADRERAVARAVETLDGFPPAYEAAWLDAMRAKLGLTTAEAEDGALATALLAAMEQGRADFTLTFRRLADAVEPGGEGPLRALFAEPAALDGWLATWRARLARDPAAAEARRGAMRAASPAIIPRNHRVEEALAAAVEDGDLGPFRRLAEALADPYADRPGHALYAYPPDAGWGPYVTFCGT
jgi:uncharacterized protein YdiU (UPF0061 family)